MSPDGHWLVVALNQSDQAAIVDLTANSPSVKAVDVGAYPYGVAISPDSKTAYVSNEYSGTISFVDIAGASQTGTVGVGGKIGDQNAHPEGMVVDPVRKQLYVAVANRDLIAVVNTASRAVTRYVSVARPEAIGTAPTALALAPDGRTLYAADSNEDALAVISLAARSRGSALHRFVRVRTAASIRRYLKLAARAHRRLHSRKAYARALRRLRTRYLYGSAVKACTGPTKRADRAWGRAVIKAVHRLSKNHRRARYKAAIRRARRKLRHITKKCGGDIAGLPPYSLIGRIPTAAYPTAVAVTPEKLLWVAGKGLGAGPNTDYNFAGAPSTRQPPPNTFGTYVLDKLAGRLGVLNRPTDTGAQAMTPIADAQVRPSDLISAPAGSPLVGPDGGASDKIKHVFYVVKENRTYDQIFGSDPHGDGDPALELFDGQRGRHGAGRGRDAERARARPEVPAARPLLRGLRGLGRRPCDHLERLRDRLLAEGAARQLLRPRAPVRLRAVPGLVPTERLRLRPGRRQGVASATTARLAAGNSGPAPTTAARPTPRSTANTDNSYPNNVLIGCLAAQDEPDPCRACTSRLRHDSGVSCPGLQGSRRDCALRQVQRRVPAAARNGHGAGVQLPDPAERPHQRHDSRRLHAAGADRRQRPRRSASSSSRSRHSLDLVPRARSSWWRTTPRTAPTTWTRTACPPT